MRLYLSLTDLPEDLLDAATSPDPLTQLIEREEQAEDVLYEVLKELTERREQRRRTKIVMH